MLRVQGCDVQTISRCGHCPLGFLDTKDMTMLTLPTSLRVFAKTGPTDMRRVLRVSSDLSRMNCASRWNQATCSSSSIGAAIA